MIEQNTFEGANVMLCRRSCFEMLFRNKYLSDFLMLRIFR